MAKNKEKPTGTDTIEPIEREPASTEQIETELKRVRFNSRYMKVLRSTVWVLVITAAVSILIVSLVLPVIQIYGTSMTPTVYEGDIVLCIKQRSYGQGDVVGLYYQNKVLVKRIIAKEFDIVDLDEDGNFTVNGVPLEEPYLEGKAYGESTDIEFPCKVPSQTYFVVGDNRRTSVDSRSSTIGCIQKDDIVGKLFLTVWPFGHFGGV